MHGILVTKHAIKRYRERFFDYSSSDREITNIMKDIASNGKVVSDCIRLLNGKTCREITFRDIFIVTVYDNNNRIVLTCLGDSPYRRWLKSTGRRSTASRKRRHRLHI